MSKEFQLICDVSPGSIGWTVKVVIAEKISPRIAQKSPTKYQNLILMDTKSTKQNLEKCSEQSREELEYAELKKIIAICVAGMIIDIKPRRIIQTRYGKECQVQDLVLINKKFDTILLTMWEAFVDNECKYISKNLKRKPVLIGKHLKVTSFNGLSLSTKADSSFFIDGEFEIVEEFKSWGHTNCELIDEIVCEKYYLNLTPSKLSSKLSIPTDEKDFTEIKNIQGLKTVKQFFWIKGKACVTVLNQTYWYMSCNNCNKISSENYGDIYHCVFCKCVEAQAIPR
ncbi:Replication protein A 70 kDa DNA-binding subunit D [Forsythia ovata]|uniref:Replication protein A 70 kDa DNA-binding subunit D n=1 Tax=Forsythia ovata TaxID=205694 RepID=A0ABD1WS11_9LAMI